MTADSRAGDGLDELQLALTDEAAFERWYQRTLPRVFSYLAARTGGDMALAEDLTQQTFVAAIAQRARFDGRSDAVTWLCGIARHKLADHFRNVVRDEHRQIRMEVREISLARTEAAPEAAVEDRTVIANAFRQLPAEQRAVLIFVVLDDLPVAEAARLLGKGRGATQSLLFRAREAFRRAYDREAAP
jgi:RNA polymerase sigma-70 factor, ECF subfamily